MQALWTLSGSGVLQAQDAKSATALIHYDSSPVGAYDEFSVIKLSPRGLSVVEMLVNSPASRDAGRALWGFPKELANLSWRRNARRVVFDKNGARFRFRILKFSFRIHARAWTMQQLNGETVRVPCEIAGRAQLAFRGKQWAVFLSNFELRVFPPITDNR